MTSGMVSLKYLTLKNKVVVILFKAAELILSEINWRKGCGWQYL